MELRPELRPPSLDKALVDTLARLADRLDGARPGQRDRELAEFNRLAGTDLALEDFQGIYKVENPDDFVRGVLYRRSLEPVPELSREEMVEVISRVRGAVGESEYYLELFLLTCPHPEGCNLIFYPDHVPELPKGREPTAQEIADCALGWEPRVVAMRVAQRSGGQSVGCYLYKLEAPDTPLTQVATSLDTVYEKGAVLAVALKGVRLEDGSVVGSTFDFGYHSYGKILGVTDRPVGSRIR